MALPWRSAAWASIVVASLAACDGTKGGASSDGTGRKSSASRSAVPAAADLASDAERTAYLVVELPSRKRFSIRHADWLDANVAPGSIAKLATISEALRRGVIDETTRIPCTRAVTLADGRRADCSHPPLADPLDSVEAIAQSCNVFATSVARRLTRAQLSSAMVVIGLAPLGPDEDLAAASIGLGQGRVAPVRLIDVLLRALAGPVAVREGLARAADRGTASVFGRAGLSAYAKTGTSRMSNGRSLGVAVAAVPRERPARAAVALVPGGTGADAAELAARLLAPSGGPAAPPEHPSPATAVRVGAPRPDGHGYAIETFDLEEYVARVVGGETGSEAPTAVRRALAIAARTFAVANAGRHRTEGFDLCTLTHCQVVGSADAGARVAAQSTAGRVLTMNGEAAPVFYSAACGGTLEDASAVGGIVRASRGLPWTHARRDPAGAQEPVWRTVLAATTLAGALRRAGFRGTVLRGLRVETNAAGRVRRVHVAGFEPEIVGGDDFRRLVGHDLGWSVIRSTRYDVTRVSTGYELNGHGHGHGAGLCVFGAGVLAVRGKTTEEILEAYFPGLTMSRSAHATYAGLSLQLPAEAERRRAALERAIGRDLAGLAATLGVPVPARLEVVVHPTSASYQRATARGPSTSGATLFERDGPVVHTMPLDVLEQSGRLESTLRHELVHVLIDAGLKGRPLWVREGLALYFAGERPAPLDGRCPPDDELRGARGAAALSSAYRRAASCVNRALASGTPWRAIGGG